MPGRLYSDHAHAQKAGSADLRHLSVLAESGVPLLSFPLMASVTYLGRRVIAQSVLPIAGTPVASALKDNCPKDTRRKA